VSARAVRRRPHERPTLSGATDFALPHVGYPPPTNASRSRRWSGCGRRARPAGNGCPGAPQRRRSTTRLRSFGGARAANDPANIARRVAAAAEPGPSRARLEEASATAPERTRQRNAVTCARPSGSSIGQPRPRHRWPLRTANAPTTTHATSTTPPRRRAPRGRRRPIRRVRVAMSSPRESFPRAAWGTSV
jgi:hypothetical protein